MAESQKNRTERRPGASNENSPKASPLARGQQIWHPRYGCGVVIAQGSAFVEIIFGSGVRLQVPRHVPIPPRKRVLKQIADVLTTIGRDGMNISGLRVMSVIDDLEYGVGQVSAVDSRFLTVDFTSQRVKIAKPFLNRPFLHLWARTIDQAREDIRSAPTRVRLIELVRVANTDAEADIRTLGPTQK